MKTGRSSFWEIQNMLTINNEAVLSDEYRLYAIRFVQSNKRALPVLYYQGNRVTQAWRIELRPDVAKDDIGKNANTT